jgi:hypothetical protein
MKETYTKPKLDIIIDIPNIPGMQGGDNGGNNDDIVIGGSTGDDDGDI